MRFCLIVILIVFSFELYAQCPAVDFEVSSSACLEQNLNITNTSDKLAEYFWTFCSDKLTAEPVPFTLNNGSNIFRASFSINNILYNEVYYGFVIRNNGLAYRFENDFSTNAITNSTSLNSSNVSLPRDFKVFQEANKYYGIITNLGSINPTLVSFGNDILNATPSYTQIVTSNPLQGTNGLDVFSDSLTYSAIGKDGSGDLIILSFNNGIENQPVSFEYSITDAVGIQGVDFINECGIWKGLVSSRDNSRLFKIAFNNGLDQAPFIEEIINTTSVVNPAKVKIVKEKGTYYAFIQGDQNNILRLDFGNSLDNVPVQSEITAVTTNGYGLDVVEIQEQYKILVVDYVNSTKGLFGAGFESQCELGSLNSVERAPKNLRLNEAGTYNLKLVGVDSLGNSSSITKEITVTSDVAPLVDFTNGADRCIGLPISFSGTGDAGINSWQWDFGDSTSASGQNVAHTYDSAGTYQITLSVGSDNGCGNLFQKEITIYEEPTASFSAESQGTVCSNKPISFINEAILPTDASFSWDFGDGTSSTAENPQHIYTNPGTYMVNFSINMAGCTASTQQTITVNEGPAVAFSNTPICFGETVQFINESNGDFITSYQWDFGDGTTSTQSNPEHLYETAGEKVVQLTAITSNGCNFTIQDTVSVSPIALVDFSQEPLCSNAAAQFFEEVQLTGSNITDYLWDFGVDGLTSDISTEANPFYTYEEAGVYEVSLQVSTTEGCVSEFSKQVEVFESPQAEIDKASACLGQTYSFESRNQGTNFSYFWELRDASNAIISTASSASFNYVFTDSGTYTLRHRLVNPNLCADEVTEQIRINAPPEVDFIVLQACQNQPLDIIYQITENGNVISAYSWGLPDGSIIQSENPEIIVEEAGNYSISLQIETETGCVQTIEKEVQVLAQPVPDFNLNQTIAANPYSLNLQAEQTENVESRWYLNGELVSSASIYQDTLREEGTYLIGLKQINENGCADSIYKQISIQAPRLNIQLRQLNVEKTDDQNRFVLTLYNPGTLTPEYIDLNIQSSTFNITERIEEELLPNQQRNVVIPLVLSETQLIGLNKLCIDAIPFYATFTDESPLNNRICTELKDDFSFLSPYPNPATTTVKIPFILPEASTVTISLESQMGQLRDQINLQANKGYNEYSLSLNQLAAGVYFLRLSYKSTEKVQKILVE